MSLIQRSTQTWGQARFTRLSYACAVWGIRHLLEGRLEATRWKSTPPPPLSCPCGCGLRSLCTPVVGTYDVVLFPPLLTQYRCFVFWQKLYIIYIHNYFSSDWLLRGTSRVKRTYLQYTQKQYIYLILFTILGPIYYECSPIIVLRTGS